MIICAAVKVELVPNAGFPEQQFIFQGLRHHDCYAAMRMAGIHTADVQSRQEGFMTHKGIFISRRAAFAHALEIGQISPAFVRLCDNQGAYELTSEDLY